MKAWGPLAAVLPFIDRAKKNFVSRKLSGIALGALCLLGRAHGDPDWCACLGPKVVAIVLGT